MKQDRMSNIELLRIIAMCGIIAIHYIAGHLGGMNTYAEFPNFSWFFCQGIYSVFCSLVNCFVLITGYFLVKSNTFGLRKAVDLIIITAFYGLVGYAIGVLCGNANLALQNIFYAIFPFFNDLRWFVETYIILIILAPFINKIFYNLDKKNFQILLTIQISIFSLWYSTGLNSPMLDDGYGIINFLTLYAIGAYLRIYGLETMLFKVNKVYFLIGYVCCTIITFALSIFIYPFGYAFITNILRSVFIFVYFLRIDIGANKIINSFSAAAFDVYFVHSDLYTSKLLIYELLEGKLIVGSVWMIPHMLFTVIVLYALGIILYKIRYYLFSKSINKWLDKIYFINKTNII